MVELGVNGKSQEKPDFFLSRAGPDAEVAKHVAHIIEKSDKRVLIQDWDFKNHGFIECMHAALTSGARVIALLSPDYLTRDHCTAEWQNAIADDPLNRNSRLILLKIRPCNPRGLLSSLAYIDLVPLLTSPHANPDLLRDVVLAAVQPGCDRHLPGDVSKLFHLAQVVLHADIEKTTSSFTGRENELDKIEKALAAGREAKAAISRPVVVHGLGGIGKSTLAREHAQRNSNLYTGVWWLNAGKSTSSGTWDEIEQGLFELWKKLYPDAPEPLDRAEAACQVMNFLSVNSMDKPWLLVYDNVDDGYVFSAWPPSTGVLVLATSRLGNWGPDIESIEIKAWEKEEGICYLQRESTRSNLTETDAGKIADTLGCLPLALRHAASYLREVTNATADSYLKALSDHMKDVPDSRVYPRAVFATLMENARQAEMHAPGAMAILSLASFYASENIPYELFEQIADNYPQQLASIIGKPLACEKAFGALDHLSLINFHTETRAFSVHRLVQAAARDVLVGEAEEWATSALRACASASPGTDFENWTAFARLLPHIHAVAAHVGNDVSAPLASLLGQAGHYLTQQGAYAEAEPFYQRAIEITQKTFGADSPTAADLLVSLACLYRHTRRINEGELHLRRALTFYEKARVPPADPRIISAMHNLAAIYHATGRHQKAESLYVGAIRFGEMKHGRDDPTIAVSLNNLASLYKDTRRFAEAEPLYKRAIDIGIKAHGTGHPDLATWQNNLAELYRLTMRYRLAEPLYKNAIAAGEEALGSEHPDLATWLGNLALLYIETGRLAAADPLLRRAIGIRKKALGRDDPVVAMWLGGLSMVCQTTGRITEAESLLEQAIAMGEKTLGPNHQNVMVWQLGLAALYHSTGRDKDAAELEARIQLPTR
jgi:tetratricopeptide (TPR) repeat protein